MCLLALTPEELSSVAKNQTPDTFECYWAQKNHRNLTLDEADQRRIATLLAAQNRDAKRFSKQKMKAAWDAAGAVGCKSVPSNFVHPGSK